MRNNKKTYFRWLMDRIDGPRNHLTLLSYLYSYPFEAVLQMDENRISDGLCLRTLYTEETGSYIEYEKQNEVYILEILIGLAVRLESDVMHDDDIGDRTGYWFWIFLDNLGLSEFDDRCFEYESGDIYGKIDRILDKFIQREYERDGSGGIFPLKNPKNDQRKVEIWYQMHAWLGENM